MIRPRTTLTVLFALFLSACLEDRRGIELYERSDGADSGSSDTGPMDTVGEDSEDTRDIDTPPETRDDTRDTADTNETDTRPTHECPVAVIDVSPGTEVAPGTVLALDGSQSHSADGAIVEYRWEVDQPIGSASSFRPSSFVNSPRLEVNVAGTYRIRLFVRDQGDTASCVPAEVTIFVNPSAALHIELLWRGTAPANPVDDVTGPDLDLHFAHPFAFDETVGDGWFDRTFDTFWYNPTPNWGQLDPAVDDDPRLVMSSDGGQGPEVITFSNPEFGTTYRVGVHVWNDRGHVDILATLRIYFHGVLVFEMSGVELSHRDFWVVTSFRWGDVDPPALMRRCEGDTLTCRYDTECAAGRCGLHVISPLNPPMFPGR